MVKFLNSDVMPSFYADDKIKTIVDSIITYGNSGTKQRYHVCNVINKIAFKYEMVINGKDMDAKIKNGIDSAGKTYGVPEYNYFNTLFRQLILHIMQFDISMLKGKDIVNYADKTRIFDKIRGDIFEGIICKILIDKYDSLRKPYKTGCVIAVKGKAIVDNLQSVDFAGYCNVSTFCEVHEMKCAPEGFKEDNFRLFDCIKEAFELNYINYHFGFITFSNEYIIKDKIIEKNANYINVYALTNLTQLSKVSFT